jgi:hypothetical protein
MRFAILVIACLLSVGAAEPTIVIESCGLVTRPGPYRLAAAWLLLGSAALSFLSLIAAFVLSAFSATQHLSRWAMRLVKVFGLIAVAGLVVGLMFLMRTIIKETRMFGAKAVRPNPALVRVGPLPVTH